MRYRIKLIPIRAKLQIHKAVVTSTSHTKHTACLSGTFVGSRIKDKFERINERGLRAVSSIID